MARRIARFVGVETLKYPFEGSVYHEGIAPSVPGVALSVLALCFCRIMLNVSVSLSLDDSDPLSA